MPAYRSRTTTHGRNMAGARGLWRATGMKDGDFGKPIIAVVNSFTQFVPGHVHLKDLGQLVAREIEAAGGVAKEFNTIAVDDGIAMGHDGMLYSLPSRDLIADSVEYMVNAHCADAMVCISNCDKITPGMLMASMRLNIPSVFVSGGPMEAGKVVVKGKEVALDLVDAMVAAARFVDLVHRTAREAPGRQVATVGRLTAEPGVANVIPGRVTLTLEIRDLSMDGIERLYEAIRERSESIAEESRTAFSFDRFYTSRAAPTDERIQARVASAAAGLGLSARAMPSGAGHDAQSIALLAPVGMIFVPSIGGISHAPEEHTAPGDVTNGANVLLHTLLAIDETGL